MTTQVKVSVNGNYHADVTMTDHTGTIRGDHVEGGKDGPTEKVFTLPHGKRTTFVVDERQMTPEEIAKRDTNMFDDPPQPDAVKRAQVAQATKDAEHHGDIPTTTRMASGGDGEAD